MALYKRTRCPIARQDQLNDDCLAWLLAPDDPGVRYLALRDLLDRPADDPELLAARQRAHTAGPIAAVLDAMAPKGCWVEPGPGYLPKYRSSVWSVILLAQLGGRVEEDERIGRACAYLLDHALAPGGQWASATAPSGAVDCLQGNLCWALAVLGRVDDPRLVNALALVRSQQDAQGRWSLDYDYTGKTWVNFGPKKQPNKWVTLRALRAWKAVALS